jgi:hypothetical protein
MTQGQNMNKFLDLHMNIKTKGRYSWTFREQGQIIAWIVRPWVSVGVNKKNLSNLRSPSILLGMLPRIDFGIPNTWWDIPLWLDENH